MENINRKLLENVISLFIIKGLEYVLAFITFPYLVRVLKVENYGLIVFSQSIVQYFVLFTDYGFNLLGPREIAQHDSMLERGKVFANIFFAKIILLVICSICFFFGCGLVSRFIALDCMLYVIFYLMVVGNVLFPVWFFQGIQQMRYITFVNIIARFLSVAGVFLFVKSPEDYLVAALCQSMVPLIAAICSWIVLFKQYPEVLIRPERIGIMQALKDGWPVFTSTIAINIYTASNVVFLGMLTNNTVVGYFSGAKKIIDNITQLFSPVSQAIYPYVSRKVTESREDAISFLRKVVFMFGGSTFLLSLCILFCAPWIVQILLGTGYESSIMFLRVMSFLPFLIALSNVFGIQTMLTFGMQKEFSRLLMLAALLNTCIVLPMIYFFEGLGVCISITLTEIFVTLAMWHALKINHIFLGDEL